LGLGLWGVSLCWAFEQPVPLFLWEAIRYNLFSTFIVEEIDEKEKRRKNKYTKPLSFIHGYDTNIFRPTLSVLWDFIF
jgi:hypothetical protein